MRSPFRGKCIGGVRRWMIVRDVRCCRELGKESFRTGGAQGSEREYS
jgi:hypothetical protein